MYRLKYQDCQFSCTSLSMPIISWGVKEFSSALRYQKIRCIAEGQFPLIHLCCKKHKGDGKQEVDCPLTSSGIAIPAFLHNYSANRFYITCYTSFISTHWAQISFLSAQLFFSQNGIGKQFDSTSKGKHFSFVLLL